MEAEVSVATAAEEAEEAMEAVEAVAVIALIQKTKATASVAKGYVKIGVRRCVWCVDLADLLVTKDQRVSVDPREPKAVVDPREPRAVVVPREQKAVVGPRGLGESEVQQDRRARKARRDAKESVALMGPKDVKESVALMGPKAAVDLRAAVDPRDRRDRQVRQVRPAHTPVQRQLWTSQRRVTAKSTLSVAAARSSTLLHTPAAARL